MFEAILISFTLTVCISVIALAIVNKHAVMTGLFAVQRAENLEHSTTSETIKEAAKRWEQAYSKLYEKSSNRMSLAIALIIATFAFVVAFWIGFVGVYVTYYMYGLTALATLNLLSIGYHTRNAGIMTRTIITVVQYINQSENSEEPDDWVFYDDIEDKTYRFTPGEGWVEEDEWVETEGQGSPDLTKEEHGYDRK